MSCVVTRVSFNSSYMDQEFTRAEIDEAAKLWSAVAFEMRERFRRACFELREREDAAFFASLERWP